MSTLSDNGAALSPQEGQEGNASCKVRGKRLVVSFNDSGLNVIMVYLCGWFSLIGGLLFVRVSAAGASIGGILLLPYMVTLETMHFIHGSSPHNGL